MRQGKLPVVYIDTKRNYYARYDSGKRTHRFEADEPLNAYWVEMLRVTPELLDEKGMEQ